jgi:hypothetical protein
MANAEGDPPPPEFRWIPLKAPEPFSFVPEEWPAYRKQIERWFRISEAKQLSDLDKRDTLLYTMGTKGDEIVTTFKDRVTDVLTFQEFLDLFDEYFQPQTNRVFARGKF